MGVSNKKKHTGGVKGALLSLAIILGIAGGAGEAENVDTTEFYETAYTTEIESKIINETEELIAISDEEDLQIQVPMASVDCEGESYTEIVSLFENAGFLNVDTYSREMEYTIKISDKTVAEISVAGASVFDENAKFSENAVVKVYYYIVLPEETEIKTQEIVDTSQSLTDNNQAVDNGTNESETMVWIPQSGSKYHSRSGCSNMKNPTQVTKEEAIDRGYEPCKRCY